MAAVGAAQRDLDVHQMGGSPAKGVKVRHQLIFNVALHTLQMQLLDLHFIRHVPEHDMFQ